MTKQSTPWSGTPFTTSGHETELALFLQPRSPHAAHNSGKNLMQYRTLDTFMKVISWRPKPSLVRVIFCALYFQFVLICCRLIRRIKIDNKWINTHNTKCCFSNLRLAHRLSDSLVHLCQTFLSTSHQHSSLLTVTNPLADQAAMRPAPNGRRKSFFVLQKTDFKTNWPTPQVVIMQKGVQIAPWPCSWTRLGDLPQTPVIGSRSARSSCVAPLLPQKVWPWIHQILNLSRSSGISQ